MANVPEFFTTKKGTRLPLLNLKGKMYLQVMHRVIWFREDHPTGVIKTQLMETNGEGKDRYYVCRAEVFIDTPKGHQLVATGYKRETVGDFADALEKSEQGSVGRALNFLGYGTQFAASEMDEGMRLADSPAPVIAAATNVTPITTNGNGAETTTRRGSFRKNVTVTAPATTSTSNGAGDDI